MILAIAKALGILWSAGVLAFCGSILITFAVSVLFAERLDRDVEETHI